ncbi:thiamine phosphate synthase [Cryobacterium melibiosiphilum]|uniref:Thiamine-phosphate synthase n=1 Tax=Cryobacterium melibiosiphilum TaxID=995039 RepID=A0A3A5MNI9_9MICO|nr:thiamine phosphate synthase [Cryobacterium melibiosiphilum]RJT88483.1 thiamine phosphate synthase [Cryobacterium melibiosiphilum]
MTAQNPAAADAVADAAASASGARPKRVSATAVTGAATEIGRAHDVAPTQAPVVLGRPTASVDLSTYLVTDAGLSGPHGVLAVIAEAVAGGVSAVQIRDKTASTREVYELVIAATRLTRGRCLLFVDDRVDVFLAARNGGAHVDGVHVGQSDLPANVVRRLIGPDALLGLTANSPAHLAAAHSLPNGTVDYFGVGVIRPTATKANHPEPLGARGFAALAASTPIPCVAIGGICLDDTAALKAAGAAGLAVVSAICAAEDARAATREFVDAWARA